MAKPKQSLVAFYIILAVVAVVAFVIYQTIAFGTFLAKRGVNHIERKQRFTLSKGGIGVAVKKTDQERTEDSLRRGFYGTWAASKPKAT